ncbi:MAG: murein hydrolase activator EnvC family protein [Ilumatobacteraceae bacterium]
MLTAVLLGVCLTLPSDAIVVDPFRAPECARCAGNRGIEYAVPVASAVRSGLSGRVVFAGEVAGVRYVVVRARDNPSVRVTYGGVGETTVSRGDVVRRGDVLGLASGSGNTATTGAATLHVGVRVGETYVDPQTMAGGTAATSARPRFRVTLGRGPTGSCGRGP